MSDKIDKRTKRPNSVQSVRLTLPGGTGYYIEPGSAYVDSAGRLHLDVVAPGAAFKDGDLTIITATHDLCLTLPPNAWRLLAYDILAKTEPKP